MNEEPDTDEATVEDLIDAIVTEPMPRDGQIMSNSDKWILAHSLLLPPGDKREVDLTLDMQSFYLTSYRNDAGDPLLASYLLSDLQSDVYEAMLSTGIMGDFAQEEVERRYWVAIYFFQLLRDKWVALDNGLTSWRHDWIH